MENGTVIREFITKNVDGLMNVERTVPELNKRSGHLGALGWVMHVILKVKNDQDVAPRINIPVRNT